jgi:hypothetical protein
MTNINGLIFLVNVNFGLKLQFIEKMFFFTTNASKNKSMWRTKLEHFFGTNMDFKFYREQKPRCEQVRMDSNILKKDHWRTGYYTFSKYHSPNILTILEKIICQFCGWKVDASFPK